MSTIVRATVISNSSDDNLNRVKVKCPLLWDESPLMPSVNGIPLKKNDIVFVDISDGVDNSYIIGRSFDNQGSYAKQVNGSLLFESSNGSDWTIAFVKNDKLEIYNSKGSKIVVSGESIEIDAQSITLGGNSSKTTINGSLSHSNGTMNITSAPLVTGLTVTVGGAEIPVMGTATFNNVQYTIIK